MIYTKEQMQQLYRAQIHFESVLKYSNIRNAPRYLTELIVGIYEEATGKTLNKNYSCASCVMNIYKIIGKTYFAQLKEQEEVARLKEQIEVVKPTKPIKKSKTKK